MFLTYSYVVLSVAVVFMDSSLCPQTVGSAVVDANTMVLGGIPTDLHMAGCLLWWLGVDSGGDRGVFTTSQKSCCRGL